MVNLKEVDTPATASADTNGKYQPDTDADSSRPPTCGDDNSSARGRLVSKWRQFIDVQLRHPETPFWRVWDVLMLSVCIFNVIMCPVAAAWVCHYMAYPTAFWIGYASDLISFVDIWISMYRRYYDDFGTLVEEEAAIRTHYLREQHGYWEIAAAIPVDLIAFAGPWQQGLPLTCPRQHFPGSGTWGFYYKPSLIPPYLYLWSALRFTKWLRLPRLYRAFAKWHMARFAVSYTRLAKNLIALLVFSHLDGCLFFLVNVFEAEGVAWIDQPSILLRRTDVEVSFFTQYLSNLATSMATMRTINTDAERILGIIEILVGSLIFGSILGVLTNFIRALDSRAALDKVTEKHRFKMDYLRRFLRQKRFPAELQRKVLQHEEFVWMRGHGVDEDRLFEGLPKSLRQEVCNFLYMELVCKVPLFKGTDAAFKASVTRAIKTINVPADFFICREGEDGQEMYFIRSGEFEALSGDLSTVYTVLQPGSFFGEIALFEGARRTATIRSRTVAELCLLTREDFQDILRMYPAVADAFRQAIAERKQRDILRKREEDERKRMEDDSNGDDGDDREGGGLANAQAYKRSSIGGSFGFLAGSGGNMRSVFQRDFVGSAMNLVHAVRGKLGSGTKLDSD
ncbi:hypothetical protein RI367_008096 [Sorochytrium milnesiophthora]